MLAICPFLPRPSYVRWWRRVDEEEKEEEKDEGKKEVKKENEVQAIRSFFTLPSFVKG